MRLSVAIFSILFLLPCSESLKILMYQTALSPSYMPFSGALADALIDAGHTVDKVIMEFNPNVPSNGSSRIRNVHRIKLPQSSGLMQSKHITAPFQHFHLPRWNPHIEQSKYKLCEALVTNQSLLNQLLAEHYDIYVTSVYDGCTFGLFQLLQIPSMVGYSVTAPTGGILELMGIPAPPSFVISAYQAKFGDGYKLSFVRRVENWMDALANVLHPRLTTTPQKVFDQYFPSLPPLASIASKMSYLFLNTNEVLDMPKPISPKVKYVGGIAIGKQGQSIDQEIEEVLSIPSKGTVLFSFGSLVKTSQIPYQLKVNLLEAFKEFPDYTFLWKYDDIEQEADLLRNYPNVHVRRWLPQAQLLREKRVKAFITHMGQNSYLELAEAGIPAIAIPLFGDQFYNTGCALKNKVAVSLDKTRLTKQEVVDALQTVLANHSFTTQANQIAQVLAKKPSPRKTFVELVEYAAEFPFLGSDLLEMASADMGLMEYLSLDVILFLFLCSSLVVAVFSVFCVKCLSSKITWLFCFCETSRL